MLNTKYKKRLGKWGEELAQAYLEKKNWKPVVANFRCRRGEIDLIMENDQTLLFVEVKTRVNHSTGWGEEAVTFFKLQAINTAIEYYLMENDTDKEIQFDVVVVEIINAEPKFIHYEALSLE